MPKGRLGLCPGSEQHHGTSLDHDVRCPAEVAKVVDQGMVTDHAASSPDERQSFRNGWGQTFQVPQGATMRVVWEEKGVWTTSAFVMRAICRSECLRPDEIYYVLRSLKAEKKFYSEWHEPEFFQRAGMGCQASAAVDRSRAGWIARTGDHAWAVGDALEAMRCYERSFAAGEEAGLAGMLRLHFVEKRFGDCLESFRRGCPPHEFYVEYGNIKGSSIECSRQYEKLIALFPGRSPYFVSQAAYMCRAVVAAAVNSGGIDDTLLVSLCDYFGVDPAQVDVLSRSLVGNHSEIARLQGRLSPKVVTSGRTFEDLERDGETPRARRLVEMIPRGRDIVRDAVAAVVEFLNTGHVTLLDLVAEAGSPYRVPEADDIILCEALQSVRSCDRVIQDHPDRYLALIRRFHPVCRHWPADYLGEYSKILESLEFPIDPNDVVSAILALAWYKTPYRLDDTSLTGAGDGMGKFEIANNREWMGIVVADYAPVFQRSQWKTRSEATAVLYGAYHFMRSKYVALRSTERWVSEAQLAEAICALFGKHNVQRHARPIWLSPQHLDLFLPSYSLAIEYQGMQHYHPVGVFGGDVALEANRRRDARKQALCGRVGVKLEYVRHDEDIGVRARQIFEGHNGGGLVRKS